MRGHPIARGEVGPAVEQKERVDAGERGRQRRSIGCQIADADLDRVAERRARLRGIAHEDARAISALDQTSGDERADVPGRARDENLSLIPIATESENGRTLLEGILRASTQETLLRIDTYGNWWNWDDEVSAAYLLKRWTLRTPQGPETFTVTGRMDADDGDVLTEWALLGQGIVLKPWFEVAEHLRQGRLVQLLPEFPPEPVSLAVVYPHRRLLPAKVKAFADFMVDEIGQVITEASRGMPQCTQTHR